MPSLSIEPGAVANRAYRPGTEPIIFSYSKAYNYLYTLALARLGMQIA